MGLSLMALTALFLNAPFGTIARSDHPHIIRSITNHSVPTPSPKQITHASWYGPGFFGNTTASGRPYDENAVFTAHRTYPFGTKLKVTNLRNRRTIVVAVEDRGPYLGLEHVGPKRDLDLSYAAAKQLDMISTGVVLVSYSKIPSSNSKGVFAR